MRSRVVLMLVSIILAWPLALWAGSAPPLPPPTFEVPFDDDNPALTQAEVTQQIAAFLENVQTHWGKNQKSIRKTVAGDLERDERDALVYTRTVAEHRVVEGYDFRDGSLVRGQYLFLQQPVNGLNEFIDYYAVVKQSLTAVYGAPAQDQTIWDNELYQPLPDYWGVAVQIGHLRYTARWETADGTLSIELTGNHHSRLMIEYRSKHFIENGQTA